MLVDDQASESRTRALRSERARATPFACPDVGPGMIAMTSAAVIQRLARRADITILFRFVSEMLGAEEWTPLSVDTIHDQTRPSGGCTSEYCARALVLTIRAYDDTAF